MYDSHVHSTFSQDGVSGFEEYAKLFDAGKLRAVGFTEHVDFLPECGSYGFFNYEKFSAEIERYKDMGYAFHSGAEIDYAKCAESEIISHLEKYTYEYVICSVHMIKGLSVSNNRDILNIDDDAEVWDIVEKYYNEVFESIEVEEFDVLGHVGVFKRYLGVEFFKRKGMLGRIRQLDSEVARLCVLKHKIVEVNSSGLFSPIDTTIPGPDFLKMYYEYGGKLVSMGSDAHCAQHVGRGFNKVSEMLKQIGFKHFVLPWNKQLVAL